jgi:hypothetical protein
MRRFKRNFLVIGGLVSIFATPPGLCIDLETLVMPGPVIKGHLEIEGDCDQCHLPFARDRQRVLCLDCHDDIASDLTQKAGFHGRVVEARSSECSVCHTDHEGRQVDIVGLDPDGFDHHLTDFVLTGAHVDADCDGCHEPAAKHREAPLECVSCHLEDDKHAGGLGRECETCHGTNDWQESVFDHALKTGYELIGGHATAQCLACHQDNSFNAASTECYACHRDDDVHEGINGADCAGCHDSRDWGNSYFDHTTGTDFALLGKHEVLECAACHTGPVHEIQLSTECSGCHVDDDVHEGINGAGCADCHSADGWTAVSFDHDVDTGFVLRGAHRDVNCGGCHQEAVHEKQPESACIGCHLDDDAHEAQLGRNCVQCHNEDSWVSSVRFDHGLTQFPLVGLHRDSTCVACHETPRFQDAPEQCDDCHRDDDYHALSLGPACGACHSPIGWQAWEFDHLVSTGFVLDGAHEELACDDCHIRSLTRKTQLDGDCVSCHRGDDVHRSDFGNDCERCHTTQTFNAAKGDGR